MEDIVGGSVAILLTVGGAGQPWVTARAHGKHATVLVTAIRRTLADGPVIPAPSVAAAVNEKGIAKESLNL